MRKARFTFRAGRFLFVLHTRVERGGTAEGAARWALCMAHNSFGPFRPGELELVSGEWLS